jgi:hypothetical protein
MDANRVLGESAATPCCYAPCWVVDIPPQVPARAMVLERLTTYCDRQIHVLGAEGKGCADKGVKQRSQPDVTGRETFFQDSVPQPAPIRI